MKNADANLLPLLVSDVPSSVDVNKGGQTVAIPAYQLLLSEKALAVIGEGDPREVQITHFLRDRNGEEGFRVITCDGAWSHIVRMRDLQQWNKQEILLCLPQALRTDPQ